MDKEFFENKEGCSEQTVNRAEVTKEIESKSREETTAEVREMLDEVCGLTTFVRDRFNEIVNKHKAVSCMANLGLVAGVSFCGKPVTFMGVGTNKALDDTFKVIMMGVMSHAD